MPRPLVDSSLHSTQDLVRRAGMLGQPGSFLPTVLAPVSEAWVLSRWWVEDGRLLQGFGRSAQGPPGSVSPATGPHSWPYRSLWATEMVAAWSSLCFLLKAQGRFLCAGEAVCCPAGLGVGVLLT